MPNKDMLDFKVCVECWTFNQKDYVLDSLNSFCRQQTSFPFVCCIIDDASTDGQQQVISSYLQQNFVTDDATAYAEDTSYGHVQFARHKKNANCYFAVLYLSENHFSTGLNYKKGEYIKRWLSISSYIALCEGDDYWIVDDKLQKQVDFLESNPDFSLCCSNVIIYNQGKHMFVEDKVASLKPAVTTINDLVKGNFIYTASVLFRNNESARNKLYSLGCIPMLDYPLWIFLSENGKIFKLEEKTTVYREGSGFWSNTPPAVQILMTTQALCKISMKLSDSRFVPMFDKRIDELKQNLTEYSCYLTNTINTYENAIKVKDSEMEEINQLLSKNTVELVKQKKKSRRLKKIMVLLTFLLIVVVCWLIVLL